MLKRIIPAHRDKGFLCLLCLYSCLPSTSPGTSSRYASMPLAITSLSRAGTFSEISVTSILISMVSPPFTSSCWSGVRTAFTTFSMSATVAVHFSSSHTTVTMTMPSPIFTSACRAGVPVVCPESVPSAVCDRASVPSVPASCASVSFGFRSFSGSPLSFCAPSDKSEQI